MRLITFFIALALASIAALISWQYTRKGDAEPQVVTEPKPVENQVQTVDVLVARDFIPIGSVLEAKQLDWQPMPQSLASAPNNQFIQHTDDKSMNAMVGLVTRAPFQPRQPIMRNQLANPNDPGFLAGTLPQGKRAVTIPVDAISGVSSFVYPGDRVDILISREIVTGQKMTDKGPEDKTEQVIEILLPNMKVLAVDTRATASGEETPHPAGSITVEATPFEAQKLRLASGNGSLSLALRSLRDQEEKGSASLPPMTKGDLSRVTKRSFFPKLYNPTTTYDPQVVNPYEQPDEGWNGTINVFRGTAKETIGVEHP